MMSAQMFTLAQQSMVALSRMSICPRAASLPLQGSIPSGQHQFIGFGQLWKALVLLVCHECCHYGPPVARWIPELGMQADQIEKQQPWDILHVQMLSNRIVSHLAPACD